MMTKTARRNVLLAVAGWAVAGGAGGLVSPLAAASVPALEARLLARLAGYFGAMGSAAALGAAYLRQAPAEAEPGRLVAGLFPGVAPATLLRWPDAVPRSTLAQRVAEDFAQSRTVILRGWVLSRGEARLFAAAALAERGFAEI
jgi:hypothetical protein